MDKALKRKLLTRKFSSIEYFEGFAKYHRLAVVGLEESIKYFYDNPPEEDWLLWHISERPDGWESRVVPNFRATQVSIKDGIKKAKGGDFSYIESTCGSMQGLSKDMDVLDWKWWDFIPREVALNYGGNMNKAKKMASNIWRTVGEYWRTEDSILNEEITGPIDESELIKYLRLGEKAELSIKINNRETSICLVSESIVPHGAKHLYLENKARGVKSKSFQAGLVSSVYIVDLLGEEAEIPLDKNLNSMVRAINVYGDDLSKHERHLAILFQIEQKKTLGKFNSSSLVLIELQSYKIIWNEKISSQSDSGGFLTVAAYFEENKNGYLQISLIQTSLPAAGEKPYMPGAPLRLLYIYNPETGYLREPS